MNIVGLLLAAGSATRFGSDKLQHSLPHGVSMAVQSARHLRSRQCPRVVAVVRPGSEQLVSESETGRLRGRGVRERGRRHGREPRLRGARGRSVRTADGYLVALGDMPFVRPSSIAAVRDALAGGAPLAAPFLRARRGHPVGIAGRFIEELLTLRGDEGAKALLAANARSLVKIPVGDPGVIRDIDTPADLAPPLRI